MAAIITPERGPTGGAPGISYALGAKVFGVPLYMPSAHGERLKHAIEDRVFDARDVSASKFIGSFDARSRFRVTDDGVALVAIQGVLVDRGPWLGDIWGIATSYEGLTEQFKRLADDAAIKAVVLDIDSPGGMVAGIYDLAAELGKLGKAKPLYALAANMAASAAYAVACVADEVYVTRTGEAGSIGVIQIHQSYARRLDESGIDTTIICEPAPKANGNPYTALSHGARAEMASGITEAYQQFVAHVAEHRGMTADAVKATQARMFSGEQAVAAGLADGVKSIDDLLDHIRKGAKATRKRRSASVRGTTQAREGGRMATTDKPDEGTNYEAAMANAIAALAEGHRAMAATLTTAAPSPAAASAGASAAQTPPADNSADQQPASASASGDAHQRIKAILECPAAKERPGLAKFLALEKPEVSAALAEDILKASPPEKAGTQASQFYAAVAATGGNPQVAHAAPSGEGAQKTRSEANIERQKQRFATANKR